MTDQNKNKQKGKIVHKYYKIDKKLGQGAFGQIFLAINTIDNSQVAVKIQSVLSKRSQLLNESKFIIDLLKAKQFNQQVNIPNVYSIGKQGNCYVMVMDLMGKSLEDLFCLCQRKFSLKTTVLIGWQMLKLIKYIHSKGVLHRDIKPDNFLIGKGPNLNKIFMIDFGLAKRYVDKFNRHIPYRDNKDLTGTARYASIHTHLGIQQGRRDDLQSWIYVLIYFVKGSLPWQSMKGQGKKQKYQKIMQKKLTSSIASLTQSLPKQFQQILSYIRSLYFNSQPDYQLLFKKLQQIGQKNNFSLQQYDYDWMLKIEQKIKKTNEDKKMKQNQLKQLLQKRQQQKRKRTKLLEQRQKRVSLETNINSNNSNNNNNNMMIMRDQLLQKDKNENDSIQKSVQRRVKQELKEIFNMEIQE